MNDNGKNAGIGRGTLGRTGGAAGTIVAIIIAIVVATQQRGRSADRPRVDGASARPVNEAPSEPAEKPGSRSERPDSSRVDPQRDRTISAAPPASPPGELRLGAWNIEWLGQPDKRSGLGASTAQSPEDMADYIIASGVSVLAVEEIVAQTQGSPRRPRSAELEAALTAVQSRTHDRWRYVLFAGRNEGDQCTGVAWNTRVVSALDQAGKPIDDESAAGWRLPIKGGRGPQGSGLWNRPPYAVQFSAGPGRTDFVVVVVHMKADYEGDFAAHRAQEAGVLADALPATRQAFHDQDLVVLGDTNMTRPDEPAKAAIEAAGLVDLNRKAETTHWRGGATDRIFVPRDQPEFQGDGSRGRFEVMSDRYLDPKRWDPRDFKRRLSDHFMVVTTIAVMVDDD